MNLLVTLRVSVVPPQPDMDRRGESVSAGVGHRISVCVAGPFHESFHTEDSRVVAAPVRPQPFRVPLTNIAAGVWEAFSDVRFMGMPMNSRTTIAKLSDGLFVCSPGELNDTLRQEIDALGEVRALAAPNRFHHLFIQDWRAAYPDASVHVPESLKKKRPDLVDTHSLGASEIAEEVAQQHMAGFPTIDETWFFHRPSGTLIDTDLMHNMHDEPRWYPRMAWRALGSWKKFGPSALERMLIRDREGFAESLDHVLEWDVHRVVVAHGEVFESSDPKASIRDAWSALLG